MTNSDRKAIKLHYAPSTPLQRQKATKTNSSLHFSMQLQGIPSVNMTQDMTELEVGNALLHSELRLTLFTLMSTPARPPPLDLMMAPTDGQ